LGKSALDILNPKSIRKAIIRYKPQVIFHLAAMTDMLACEKNPKQAQKINGIGTRNVAKACKENKIKLVYLSTCAVFDGKKKTPYKETDLPKPINIYGKTKLLGELAAQDLLSDALIVRTGWLFGGGLDIDKKFVALTFQKLQKGSTVKATADRCGSPTYIPDLLQAVEKLIHKNAKGIVHVVNDGTASYFEIAKAIKKIGKFNLPILPVKTSEVEPPKLKRGKMEALTSSRVTLRPWKKSLKQYLDELQRR
jgi:dTDP-4-dehydrorhamnose reductase